MISALCILALLTLVVLVDDDTSRHVADAVALEAAPVHSNSASA